MTHELSELDRSQYYKGIRNPPTVLAVSENAPRILRTPHRGVSKSLHTISHADPIVPLWCAVRTKLYDWLKNEIPAGGIVSVIGISQHRRQPVQTVWVSVPVAGSGVARARQIVHGVRTLLDSGGLKHLVIEVNQAQRRPMSAPLVDFRDWRGAEPAYAPQQPLFSSVGCCISITPNLDFAGSGAVIISAGPIDKRVKYLVTAAHNVDPLDPDTVIIPGSGPRRDVYLLNDAAFAKYVVKPLGDAVEELWPDLLMRRARAAERLVANIERDEAEYESLTKLKERLEAEWGTLERRHIGHVAYCLPRGYSPTDYTVDLALIELDPGRFEGLPVNVLEMRDSAARETIRRTEGATEAIGGHFTVPITAVAQPGDIHLGQPVFKRGFKTGLTVGRVNGIDSMELNELGEPCYVHTVIGESHTHFSKKGDSGSAIVGANGDWLGLLTGGMYNPSDDEPTDITYFSPAHDIMAIARGLGLQDVRLEKCDMFA